MTSRESTYEFESGDGYVLIALLPSLNDCPWSDIERAGSEILERLKTTKHRGLFIDLTQLDYMGSAMVALIVRLWKAAKEQDERMIVIIRNELVLEVLQLAGLDKVWTIVSTREEAFRELGVSGHVTEEIVERQRNTLLIVGALAIIGAVVGVGLLYFRTEAIPASFAIILDVGCALLGIVTGALITVGDGQPSRRLTGLLFVIVSIAAIVVGFLVMNGNAGETARRPAIVHSAPTEIFTDAIRQGEQL